MKERYKKKKCVRCDEKSFSSVLWGWVIKNRWKQYSIVGFLVREW